MSITNSYTDDYWMAQALSLAKQAQANQEVPIGALIVYNQQVIGQGYNCPINTHDPSAHAEIQAIRQAGLRLNNYRLPNTTMYVTLEPCVMCAGAIIHARIDTVIYAASDLRVPGLSNYVFNEPRLNHHPKLIGGVLAEEASQLLKTFFMKKRSG